MPYQLDLRGGVHQLFAAAYLTPGPSVLRMPEQRLEPERVDELCEWVVATFEQALQENCGQAPYDELVRCGRCLRELLPASVAEKLSQFAAQVAAAAEGQAFRPPLVVQHDDQMMAVPWELVVVDQQGTFLADAFAVGRQIHTFTEQAVATSRPAPSTGRLRMLVVADPEWPAALAEGRALIDRFRGHRAVEAELLGTPGVTLRMLSECLEGCDILHFAGDAVLARSGSEQVGLRLSSGDRLDALAVRTRLGLKRWPWLVFANACRTALIEPARSGAGPEGLGWRLLLQGVAHYISTAARIPDDCGAPGALPIRLYELLLEGAGVGAALHAARREVAPPDGDPRLRLVAACYRHYGNPEDCLAAPATSPVGSNAAVDAVLALAIAIKQGRNDPLARAQVAELAAQAQGATRRDLEALLADDQRDRQQRERFSKEVAGTVGYRRLQPGTRIGPYELVSELGSGNRRSVWLALSYHPDVPAGEVALAIPHNQQPDAVRRRCEVFARLVPRLSGRGCVPLHDVGVYDGIGVLAYGLARGDRLDTLMVPGQPWPVDDALELLEELGATLQAAHGAALVHEELTPHAVVVPKDDGPLWVLDFGRAEAERCADEVTSEHRRHDPYRSPAQWSSARARATPEADDWALSVLAYELFTGQHPFAGEVVDGDWSATVGCRPRPPVGDLGGLTPGMLQALFRALDPDREARFPSALELVQALRRERHERPRLGGFVPDLELALDAGARLLYIQAEDELDALQRLERLAAARDLRLVTWRASCGLTDGIDPWGVEVAGELAPEGAVQWLNGQSPRTMLVLLDAADRLAVPELERLVYDCAARAPAGGEGGPAMVLMAPVVHLPDRLQHEAQLFLPEPLHAGDVAELIREPLQGGEDPAWMADAVQEVSWHGAGLTSGEVRLAVRRAVARQDGLFPEVAGELRDCKAQAVRRQGLLELVEPGLDMGDVVGLHGLKEWFALVCLAADSMLRDGFLPAPSGVLLGGMSGCGKSLCARAMAGTLRWPLLRLDSGKLYTVFLGGAESNLRAVFRMAEAMSPLVLWIDEIEKAFGETATAGSSQRVLQGLLTWLQERRGTIFVVATANEHERLPVELIRAGRLDQAFFVDLPDAESRADMLRRELARWRRAPGAHDFAALAADTEGQSYAELAGRVVNALYVAAAERRTDPLAGELRAALLADPRPPTADPLRRAQLQRLRDSWSSLARPAG